MSVDYIRTVGATEVNDETIPKISLMKTKESRGDETPRSITDSGRALRHTRWRAIQGDEILLLNLPMDTRTIIICKERLDTAQCSARQNSNTRRSRGRLRHKSRPSGPNHANPSKEEKDLIRRRLDKS